MFFLHEFIDKDFWNMWIVYIVIISMTTLFTVLIQKIFTIYNLIFFSLILYSIFKLRKYN